MNVNLGDTFDRFVAQMLSTGHYQSQSEVLREALRLLKEREATKRLRLDSFRKELEVGIKQADRGQFKEGDKVFRKIRKRSTALRRRAA